jgi:flagellar biogenesis protein FliO
VYIDNGDDNNNDDEVEKTLAIIIGLIAAVALIIVFISFLNKLCESGKGMPKLSPFSCLTILFFEKHPNL